MWGYKQIYSLSLYSDNTSIFVEISYNKLLGSYPKQDLFFLHCENLPWALYFYLELS
jgi:hypothetical protein